MIAPHLRGGGFHVPIEVVQSALTACGIEIIDPTLLRARCPAEDLHTTSTGPGDCVIFPNDNAPQIFCHHTSCATQTALVNEQLRARSQRGNHVTTAQPVFTAARRQTWQERHRRRKALEEKAAALLPRILEKYHWPANTIQAESTVEISLPVERQHRLIFDLFDDKDVLWCAPAVTCSGARWHDKYFRTASRWSQEYKCPGAFICPNPFETGAFSRSDANIARRRFLVVESDTLNRDQVGAVFKWMSACLGMSLRAVVDTGGRSLHAWFECPSEGLLKRLEIILPILGCDPAMFRPAQPCRLPGVRRPETRCWQELLYLDHPSPGAVATNVDASSLAGGVAI